MIPSGFCRLAVDALVSVLSGVDDGQKLRVKGEGDAGLKGGEAGDLYIFISVEKDPVFRRDGVDLYSNIKVSFIDALLGTKIKVRNTHTAPLTGTGGRPALGDGLESSVRKAGWGVYSRTRSLCVGRRHVSCPLDGALRLSSCVVLRCRCR